MNEILFDSAKVIVTIKDRAMLSRVSPARAGTYLYSKGWKRTALEPNRYSLWVKVSADSSIMEILLPLETRLGDFSERMAELND